MKKNVIVALFFTLVLTVVGAELKIEDFSTVDSKIWKASGGGWIVKTAEGAQLRQPGIVTRNVPGNYKSRRDWSPRYNGIAFKVKGDGSNDYGSICLGVDYFFDFYRYFPLKNTQRQEFRILFEDFTAIMGKSDTPHNASGNITIDGLQRLRFGDRGNIGPNNAKRTEAQYEVANIRLIDDAQTRFAVGSRSALPFKTVRQKLRNRETVNILGLGNSIPAGTGLRQADGTRYADLLGKILREQYHFAGASSRSAGVGGSCLFDARTWVDR